ncbi:oligosaccharide flippase family protein [Alteromonadaceae bacterium BrNp21-10]|nr:oligosaccharide flippase family protein [Alteromonadaceae bacterium BrNp21-10]
MNIQKRLANAYLWNLVGIWGTRLIGITSTLILVRLIEPAAFGLVALATVCIGFFNTFATLGINRYLISQTDLNPIALNTSWTLSILIKSLITVILILSSNALASFVGAPEVALIIIVIASVGLIDSFKNIGIVQYEKNLDFKKLNLLSLTCKIFSTALTLSIAYFYPNYWALVCGAITHTIMYMIGTYVICEYRPSFNFQFEKKQFLFSIKIIFRAVIGYSRSKLDTFLVGKLFTTSAVGKYSIGLEFALLPLTEIIAPATNTMFPGLSQFKNSPKELLDKTYKYLALVYMFVIPCIVGVWFVSQQFCTVILGEKWSETAPIMSSLALLMLPFPLTAITNNLFDFLNKTGRSIFGDIVGIALLLICFWTISFDSIEKFSLIRGFVGVLVFCFLLIFARFTIHLSLRKMISVLIIPFISASGMYAFFTYCYVNNEISLLGLVINVVIGAVVYSSLLMVLIFTVRHKLDVWDFWYKKILEVIKIGVVRLRFY